MKDLMRLRSLLGTEVEALLNNQIKMEAYNSSVYLAMASWCDRNGFDYSADHFYKQAEDEREHMLRFFKYVSDMGGTAVSPSVDGIPQEFESFREVFETALELEVKTTQAINNIADKCYKEKDHVTVEFLNWFHKEQREEEYVARRCLELFEVIGEEGTGRWEIDKAIPSVSYGNE
ncbi:ferritin [Xanthocytophaga agilis]|uniref:Ferritin n=1 Tax=Xanthocytophaga agilis TaxID=3048010 RepID=A0AAE3R466_9BACT|nr:ferritin [Xanthocytophaga agilis]MDJ1500543.1 ferritin [Xanthocytophaga agilis]